MAKGKFTKTYKNIKKHTVTPDVKTFETPETPETIVDSTNNLLDKLEKDGTEDIKSDYNDELDRILFKIYQNFKWGDTNDAYGKLFYRILKFMGKKLEDFLQQKQVEEIDNKPNKRAIGKKYIKEELNDIRNL